VVSTPSSLKASPPAGAWGHLLGPSVPVRAAASFHLQLDVLPPQGIPELALQPVPAR